MKHLSLLIIAMFCTPYLLEAQTQYLWINTGTLELVKIDISNNQVTVVGTTPQYYTDIAFGNDDNLYACSLNTLYKLDQNTAAETYISAFPISASDIMVGLVGDNQGNLWACSADQSNGGGNIYKMPIAGCCSGSILVGHVQLSPAGDLAFKNGELFMACSNNELLKINLNGAQNSIVSTTVVGLMAVSAPVLGIATDANGVSYAADNSGNLYDINFNDAVVGLRVQLPSAALGMAFFGEANNTGSVEICGNGIDDNNDGLIDVITTNRTYTLCANKSVTVGTHTYNTTGVYTDHILSFRGCDSVVISTVNVNPLPTATYNRSICTGASYTIGTHTYTLSGTYVDTLVMTVGCDSVITTNLSLIPAPQRLQTKTICQGSVFTLNGHQYSNPGVYRDTISNLTGCDSIIITTLIVQQPTTTTQSKKLCFGEQLIVGNHIYSENGVYRDTIASVNNCDSIIITTLNVVDLKVALGEDIILERYAPVTLKPIASNGIYNRYDWSNSNSLSCSPCRQPNALPKQTTTYTVTATDGNGCSGTDDIIIIVPLSEVYIPNTFTPNGDGQNDIFTVYANPTAQMIRSFKVFDRWGELLYAEMNLPINGIAGWDGSFQGTMMQPGVFTYTVQIEYADGSLRTFNGDITLLH